MITNIRRLQQLGTCIVDVTLNTKFKYLGVVWQLLNGLMQNDKEALYDIVHNEIWLFLSIYQK